jgi:hypothetical protein
MSFLRARQYDVDMAAKKKSTLDQVLWTPIRNSTNAIKKAAKRIGTRFMALRQKLGGKK